ncbi:uncharacterized protein DS421_6g186090 [Arachis hypogaea]|nr:uncharacterized protein DS421_6g186090 [Arachis hypogaea]
MRGNRGDRKRRGEGGHVAAAATNPRRHGRPAHGTMSRALSLNGRGKEGKEGRRWLGATTAVASCRPCPAREEETNERTGAQEGRKVSRGGFVPLPLRQIAACAARSVVVSCHEAAVKPRRRGSAVAVSPLHLKMSVVTAAKATAAASISDTDTLGAATRRSPESVRTTVLILICSVDVLVAIPAPMPLLESPGNLAADIITDSGRHRRSKVIGRAAAGPIWSCGCFVLLI